MSPNSRNPPEMTRLPTLLLALIAPHWTSTTVRPTGARLRVRCLRARGSIGAPSETADFKRSNGTGFDSRTGSARFRLSLPLRGVVGRRAA